MATSPGWWPGLIGPAGPSTRDSWFVVAANVLGGCRAQRGRRASHRTAGNGAAASPTSRFVTRWTSRLACSSTWASRAWRPWSAGRWEECGPSSGRSPIPIVSTAASCWPARPRDGGSIAWCQPQLLAIQQDPDYAGGDYYRTGRSPEAGLGLARRIAHITYRTESELGERFSRDPQLGEDPLRSGDRGRFAVETISTTTRQAGPAVRRQLLCGAHRGHELPRCRPGPRRRARARPSQGSVHHRLRRHRPALPARLSDDLHDLLPTSVRAHPLAWYGHDGFLIEDDQVGGIIRAALASDPPRGEVTTS